MSRRGGSGWLASLVALAVAGGGPVLSVAADPASPGLAPRFFGLEATGQRVVYVCDRSASMSEPDGAPLAMAKRELIASLEGLGDARQFHLIFYNERQSVFEPPGGRGRPMFADDATLREVRRFIEGTTAAGGTRHAEAVAAALRLAPDVVFLLTDADAPHDLSQAEFERLSDRLGATRVMVVQFGGTEGRRSPRLARLASTSGGIYRVVEPGAD